MVPQTRTMEDLNLGVSFALKTSTEIHWRLTTYSGIHCGDYGNRTTAESNSREQQQNNTTTALLHKVNRGYG